MMEMACEHSPTSWLGTKLFVVWFLGIVALSAFLFLFSPFLNLSCVRGQDSVLILHSFEGTTLHSFTRAQDTSQLNIHFHLG